MIRDERRPFFLVLKWLLVAGWAGFIWILLTLPAEQTPDVSFIPFGDKLGHAGVYCVWGLLICWAWEGSFRALSRFGVGAVCLTVTAAYGVLSEVYQVGIGRDADSLDVAADLVGAVVAQYLYFSPRVKALLKKRMTGRIIAMRRGRHRFSSHIEHIHSENTTTVSRKETPDR